MDKITQILKNVGRCKYFEAAVRIKNPIKNSYQDGLGRTTQTSDHNSCGPNINLRQEKVSNSSISDQMVVLNMWSNLRWRLGTSWNRLLPNSKSWRRLACRWVQLWWFTRYLRALPSRFDIFVRIVQTKKVLPTLEELNSRLQRDETNAGLKDHDAVEEAIIVQIRSVLRGRNRYVYSCHGWFKSQLIGSSSYSPREGNFHRTSLKGKKWSVTSVAVQIMWQSSFLNQRNWNLISWLEREKIL